MLWLWLACVVSENDLVPVEDDPLFATAEEHNDGGAFASWTMSTANEAGLQVHEEHFRAGEAPTAVVDFLFVMDNSGSMLRVLPRVQQGLMSLRKPGLFPRSARIAVMNATPGDPHDLQVPHPEVLYATVGGEGPGFLKLVDADNIRPILNYQLVADGTQRYVFMPGCPAWFSPFQTNAMGHPCLIANTQIRALTVGPEAGLTALAQWLEKTAGQPRFRPGAAVNVVFISDTHDPGHPSEDLYDLQPTTDELWSLLEEDDVVSSFRLHAIAPETECGETWDIPSYFDAADETGGVTADICTTHSYASVIHEIVQTSAFTQRPVYRLHHPAEEVLSVTYNGTPVAYTVLADGAVIELLDDDADNGVIRVRYAAAQEG